MLASIISRKYNSTTLSDLMFFSIVGPYVSELQVGLAVIYGIVAILIILVRVSYVKCKTVFIPIFKSLAIDI